jgi:hypothetical protein
MPDTMTERVARAIDPMAWSELPSWWPLGRKASPDDAPLLSVVCRDNEPLRRKSLDNARAAIAAMREPTGPMWDAGRAQLSAGEGVMDIYCAMIDTALKETPDADPR